MEIVERVVDEVVILDLSGSPSRGPVDTFRDKLDSLEVQGRLWVVLNCEELTFIDVHMASQMLRFHILAQELEGGLKLCGMKRRVAQLLKNQNLFHVLDIFDDEVAALSSFYHHQRAHPR